jgi:hypothetical protein
MGGLTLHGRKDATNPLVSPTHEFVRGCHLSLPHLAFFKKNLPRSHHHSLILLVSLSAGISYRFLGFRYYRLPGPSRAWEHHPQ